MQHEIRWTSQKIAGRLRLVEGLVYRRREPLASFRLRLLDGPQDDPFVSPPVEDEAWLEVRSNSYWIKLQEDFLLTTRFAVSPDWRERGPVALFLPLGESGDFSHPEALVMLDGTAYAACDRHHQEILLPEALCDGQDHLLALHGWSGGTHMLRFDGRGVQRERNLEKRLWMGSCAVVQIDQPTRDFVALARVALGLADVLSPEDPVRGRLYTSLDDAFKALDTREPFGDRFYASVAEALQILRSGVSSAGKPLDVMVTAVGHAHIDVAWLWTLGQTRRKAGRSFYNALRLMEQFPRFRFVQSQPQLYDYVRQDDPQLFKAIKERVHRGEWEPLGGMWVEADCNLSGSEPLARQFLLGRRFFREHFGDGADSPVLWLPDVFGYAWNLPQLMQEAGLAYFFTIKIGWSQYNRLPYDSFWWQGLDGTQVLTHFSPTKDPGSAFASTYNSAATPAQVLGTWTNFQQKDGSWSAQPPPLLLAYGYGDGGGGPTREMAENLRELASFPAAPRVRQEKVVDFFRALEDAAGDRLPVWNGELYLEYHRGTYTTQGRNKRANRQSEFNLHDTEFLAVMAAAVRPDYSYPHRRLQRAWELVCLNQFHDILPGSSIGAVYEESMDQYAEVERLCERIRDEAMAVIAEDGGAPLLVVNPTSFTRREPVFVPGDGSASDYRSAQAIAGGCLVNGGEWAPYSVATLQEVAQDKRSVEMARATDHALENAYLRVEFDDNGDIERIFDKVSERDILPPGALGNQFQVFEDRPRTPDAWEIDIYYDDRMWYAEPASAIRVLEAGPLRATLEIRRRVLNSELHQRISLAHHSRRLDFRTEVDWRERHVLLKVAFPVDILSPAATYEIQWGNVERPTHRNTSWDWARFETCAQKWVDLSEGDYGVSLLNNGKYGHDIWNNVIRLTLLRGATEPDPAADLGRHWFTYSLLPHEGPWGRETMAEAYALNDPLIVSRRPGAGSAPSQDSRILGTSFVSVDRANVVIETVKQAEDGNGIIVRLYEAQRQRGRLTLACALPLAGAWRTNLLEEDQERLKVNGRRIELTIRPYQIVTLRLVTE